MNPIAGCYYLVGNHSPWIFDVANAQAAGLPARYVSAIQEFDPIKNDDEVRLLAVLGGLVRVREHLGRTQFTSVQFFYDQRELPIVRCAVTGMLRRTSGD